MGNTFDLVDIENDCYQGHLLKESSMTLVDYNEDGMKPMKLFKVSTFGKNYDLNIATNAIDALRQSMFRHNRGWTLADVVQICRSCREETNDNDAGYCSDKCKEEHEDYQERRAEYRSRL